MNINKEDQKFLLDLSKKMNEQDKRSTSYVYFMVMDKEKEYGQEEYGYDERERSESTEDHNGDTLLCEKCLKLADDSDDLPEDCDDCDDECFHNYKWVDRIQIEDGVFLTAEACDEYIQRRIYSFNKPRSYGLSNYRSNEMRQLMEIICKLTSDNLNLR